MKDSGVEWIGEIPEGWETKRNKYIFRNKKRIVGERSKNYKLLSLTKNKGIIYKDINNNEGKLPASFDTYQEVTKGDLVLCLFDLDISAVFSDVSQYDGMISPAYSVFDISKNCVARFYKYWFKMVGDDRKYKVYSKSLRNTIDINNFNNIFSVIPPRQEQQEIANFLDSKVYLIDDIIEKTKQSIEDYRKYKQSLITETVTKGLNPDVEMKDSGIEWIGEIPKQWQAVRLKNVTRLRNEKISNNDSLSYISLEDIESKTGRIIPKVNKEKQFIGGTANVFYEGDVLFGKLRPYLAKCIVADFNGKCSTELLVIQAVGGFMNNLYLKYLMLSGSFIDLVNSSTYGTKMPRASWDFIREQYIPMPTYREQKQIADYLDNKCSHIDKVIEQKETLINELEMYKKSLIYEYVTGKKRVGMQE